MGRIWVDSSKCTGCRACTEVCGMHVFEWKQESIKVDNEQRCILCGHCVCVCPVDALRHEGLDTGHFLPSRDDMRVSQESLIHFLRFRRSCRTFEDRDVPRSVLEELIDVARYAPSGTNIQNVEFVVLQDRETVMEFSRMAGAFYGNYVRDLETSGQPLPVPTARRMEAFRIFHQFHLEGKDRIFRGGRAAIVTHTPLNSAVSADNCHYALFHIILMAQAMGLGTCLLHTFVLAAEKNPSIKTHLGIPDQNQVFGCVTLGYPKFQYRFLPARNEAKVTWL